MIKTGNNGNFHVPEQPFFEGDHTAKQGQQPHGGRGGAPQGRAARHGSVPPRLQAAAQLLEREFDAGRLNPKLTELAAYDIKAVLSGTTRVAGAALGAAATGMDKVGAFAHKSKQRHKASDARTNHESARKQLESAKEKMAAAERRHMQALRSNDPVAVAKAQVKVQHALERLTDAESNMTFHLGTPAAGDAPQSGISRTRQAAYAAKAVASGMTNGLATALGAAARGMQALHGKALGSKEKQRVKLEKDNYHFAMRSHEKAVRKTDRLKDKQARLDVTDPKLLDRMERSEARRNRAHGALINHLERATESMQGAAAQQGPTLLPPQPQQQQRPPIQQISNQQVPNQQVHIQKQPYMQMPTPPKPFKQFDIPKANPVQSQAPLQQTMRMPTPQMYLQQNAQQPQHQRLQQQQQHQQHEPYRQPPTPPTPPTPLPPPQTAPTDPYRMPGGWVD
jgi:hypothetical protein